MRFGGHTKPTERFVIVLRMQRSDIEIIQQAQSDLIIPEPLPIPSLSSITQEIVGYFIVENHVLNTTGSFRSEREVEDLWDALISRLSNAVEDALRNEKDPDTYLKVKEALLGSVMTLEVSSDHDSSTGFMTDTFRPIRTPPGAYTQLFCGSLRSMSVSSRPSSESASRV